MKNQDEANGNDDLPVNRRDVLRTVGAAGALGTVGVGNATAQPSREFVVGVDHGRADAARRRANSVRRTIDFGNEIGEAIVGRWPEQALRGLRRNPNVRYVEENGTMEPLNHPDELDRSDGVDRVDAEVAHAFGKTGTGIDIAILDTGIQPDHPDLVANIDAGHAEDGCECQDKFHRDTCADDWDDDDSHGTHVAGTAGAIHDGEQVVGIAPDATLHAIKVCRWFDPDDDDPFVGCPHDCIGSGLETAADEGYDVVNMSLGSCCPSCDGLGDDCCTDCFDNIPSVVADGLQAAADADVTVVAAAGNDGNRGDPCDNDCDGVCDDDDCVSRPAHDSRAMAVSSIRDWNDTLSGFSSVGPEVEIAAPGSAIFSTVPGDGIDDKSGTSMASPHVAGAAALVLEDGSYGTSPDDVKDRLKNTAEDIGLGSREQGSGLLDVPAALDCPEPTAAFEWDPDVPDEEERVLFDASDSDVPDPNSIVEYKWNFGDGSIETTTDPLRRHTYSDWGNFDVTLTVTDEAGQTDDTTQEIRVNAIPEATFEWTPSVPNEGDDIEFDAGDSFDSDGDIVSYEWDFGDGNTATGETVTHNYGPAGDGNWGEFDVTLAVTDDDDASDEVTETVRVNAYPIAEAFTITPSLPNEGDDIEFDASDSFDPDGDIDEYHWDFGDGTTETTSDPTIEYNYGPAGEGNWGDFDVTLTVTDDDGASHEEISVHEQEIRVNAYPIAEPFDIRVGGELMDPPENPVVRDEPVEFDASDSFDPDGEIDDYDWDFGDGNTGTGEIVTHTYDGGGEKTVTLTVTDDDGASHEDISVHEETFTVHIRVTIDIKPGSDPNSINPNGNGEIPVAVLHRTDFDPPTELDPGTVRFGAPDTVNADDGAEPVHDGGHIEDTNEDGDDDWIGHFPVRESGFERGDDEGKLVGETTDDEPIPVFGFDDVNTVGRGGS